jgi:alpha-1,2-mannosyltransferase
MRGENKQMRARVVLVCATVALGLRLGWLLSDGHLLGVTDADDGVLFGDAIRLMHGVIPYRDFSDVQPPGSTLMMAPVALLARVTGSDWGLAIARLLTVAADVACVVVIGRLLRHRGLVTVAVACGGYAIYPDALSASRTFLLEPWLNLCCLLGAVAVFEGDRLTASRRRLLLGGIAFGFAVALKLWALLPVAVLALLLRRRIPGFAAGFALGCFVPSLPFWLLAPSAFTSGVFTGQFNRSHLAAYQAASRLADLAGGHGGRSLWIIGAGMLTLIALGYLARRPAPLDVYMLSCAAGAIVMLILPRLYYSHYGSFAGAFATPVLAMAAGNLAGRKAVIGGAALAAALVLTGVGDVVNPVQLPAVDSVAVAERLIPEGACVVTDAPSYTVAADRFTASGPCPAIVDAQGTLIAMTDGLELTAPPGERARVSALWLDAFTRARYIWLLPGTWTRIPWDPPLLTYLSTRFAPIAFLSARPAVPGTPRTGLYVRVAG